MNLSKHINLSRKISKYRIYKFINRIYFLLLTSFSEMTELFYDTFYQSIIVTRLSHLRFYHTDYIKYHSSSNNPLQYEFNYFSENLP